MGWVNLVFKNFVYKFVTINPITKQSYGAMVDNLNLEVEVRGSSFLTYNLIALRGSSLGCMA
jgi:hypothetical protein